MLQRLRGLTSAWMTESELTARSQLAATPSLVWNPEFPSDLSISPAQEHPVGRRAPPSENLAPAHFLASSLSPRGRGWRWTETFLISGWSLVFLRPMCGCTHQSGVWWPLPHIPVRTLWGGGLLVSTHILLGAFWESVHFTGVAECLSPLKETQGSWDGKSRKVSLLRLHDLSFCSELL